MHTTDKYAKGGMMYDLKQDDYVWNEVGKKLIVDKVTKDEYYLTSFGQSGASPFSKSKVNSYLKSGKWSLKPKKQEIMANGGNVETALQNFDVHNLDSFEKQQYDMLFNRIGKEETLRILINNVEGDYSQLSPKLRALAKKYKLSQGITMAKGGKIKPKMVRTQFEEEEFDYGKGGAIYKGDKVKIKDSSKKMVVKDISKGRKGYVEFSGDAGTYLKGDLEKMEKGGYTMPNNCWCYEIGGL
jgi:glutamyl/glutaminyl-tRNA synthetase